MGINIIYYIFFDIKRSIKTEGRIPDAIAAVFHFYYKRS